MMKLLNILRMIGLIGSTKNKLEVFYELNGVKSSLEHQTETSSSLKTIWQR